MNDLVSTIFNGASEIWPGITWAVQEVNGIIWIAGFTEDGRQEQLGIPVRDTVNAPDPATVLSSTCDQIARKLAPTFIDFTQVGA